MPRDARAYLADIIEACKAIAEATADLELPSYQSSRLVRSSVEREFIIIREAMAAFGRAAPQLFASLSHARRAVDFRNLLTHAYSTVDDSIVWATGTRDAPALQSVCALLLDGLNDKGEAD